MVRCEPLPAPISAVSSAPPSFSTSPRRLSMRIAAVSGLFVASGLGSASVAGFDVMKQAHQVRQSIGVALQEAGLEV